MQLADLDYSVVELAIIANSTGVKLFGESNKFVKRVKYKHFWFEFELSKCTSKAVAKGVFRRSLETIGEQPSVSDRFVSVHWLKPTFVSANLQKLIDAGVNFSKS